MMKLESLHAKIINELDGYTNHVERLTNLQSAVMRPATPTGISAFAIKHRLMRLPERPPHRFFGRKDLLENLDKVLMLNPDSQSIPTATLWGSTGVGKSAIAAEYAYSQYKVRAVDIVLWMASSTLSALRYSSTGAVRALDLPGARLDDHNANVVILQDWLQVTSMYSHPHYSYID